MRECKGSFTLVETNELESEIFSLISTAIQSKKYIEIAKNISHSDIGFKFVFGRSESALTYHDSVMCIFRLERNDLRR